MSRYYVRVQGCDDGTPIVMDLTDDEADVVARVANEVNRTSYSTCMPQMLVRLATPSDEEEAREELAAAEQRRIKP